MAARPEFSASSISGRQLPERHGFRGREGFLDLGAGQVGLQIVDVVVRRQRLAGVDARVLQPPIAVVQRRALGFDAAEKAVGIVEREDGHVGELGALLAAGRGVDDRLAVLAALAQPEAAVGRAQDCGCRRSGSPPAAPIVRAERRRHRIVDRRHDDADEQRDHDRRRTNCQADMPAERATTSSSRRDRFEIADHRADQHRERHDALGDVRHPVERDLRHQQARKRP